MSKKSDEIFMGLDMYIDAYKVNTGKEPAVITVSKAHRDTLKRFTHPGAEEHLYETHYRGIPLRTVNE